MSETKHSPEPWREMPDEDDHLRQVVAPENGLVAATVTPEDARRIVACVNALAGIPTEALEDGSLEGWFKAARLASEIHDLARNP